MVKRREPRIKPEEREFEQKVIDLARVTRVVAGGKRMRFRACMAIGDGKGRVGIGVAKGADVTIAINKAVNKAKRNLITVFIISDTIPFEVRNKYKAAKVLLKPAPRGTGVKAGGAMRVILELAGIPNVVGKILGSSNKINIVRSTIEALNLLNNLRGKKLTLGVEKTEEEKNKGGRGLEKNKSAKKDGEEK